MRASETDPAPTFGFMTVVDLGQVGTIGGYLILNTLGRPVEFHCTEPVRPNRAQEILYGATLKAYLHGEQIGQALFNNGAAPPQVVFVDEESMLSLRDFCDVPVVWIHDEPQESLWCFSIGDARVSVDLERACDESLIVSLMNDRKTQWCLREPFTRIRDAVSELQKAA